MKSKWFELKPRAIELRQQGISLRKVEKILKIPRSTLSGWFKHVKLTEEQILKLRKGHIKHLKSARKEAIKWHNLQKETRIKYAESEAKKTLLKLDCTNEAIQELALAMLYLGEGSKGKSGTAMGSSDPLILRFFVNYLIKKVVDINKIKCSLHLRADQNPKRLTNYWSETLKIPLKNFTQPSIDLRTKNRPTYPNYNGVCVINCGNIALQRKLVFLSKKFCEEFCF